MALWRYINFVLLLLLLLLLSLTAMIQPHVLLHIINNRLLGSCSCKAGLDIDDDDDDDDGLSR